MLRPTWNCLANWLYCVTKVIKLCCFCTPTISERALPTYHTVPGILLNKVPNSPCNVVSLNTSVFPDVAIFIDRVLRVWRRNRNCSPVLKYIILTDKHNRTDLMCWFLFSTATCFRCLHQPSSGRHRFTTKLKKREVFPSKQWCKIIIVKFW
jgi:hypothetical protein